MKITKEILENSIKENEDFMQMVCEKKYGHKNLKNVIWNVIDKCGITDVEQQNLMLDNYFIPAGSILTACNTDKKVSLSNCYLSKIEGDSIEAIYEAHKKIARTYSYRGGSGVDITVLRPADTPVNNAAITSSGAVSFMPSFSTLTETIGQNGRRGALIITMDIRHPDALRFIWSKAKPENVFETDLFTGKVPDISGANISLKVTNSFMNAVKNDDDWEFYFPDYENQKELYDEIWDGDYDKWALNGGQFKSYGKIKAKEVMRQIAEAAHTCGDPGIFLIDNVQENTFGTHIHDSLKPMSCNPCGEQPLAYWNNCMLGAFVLHRYVKNQFTERAYFDCEQFNKDVRKATRIMNLISDYNEDKHPLPEQIEADKFGKRIGIEVTGVGDTLAMMGIRYDSEEAEDFLHGLSEIMTDSCIYESIELAKEKGCCPALASAESRKNLIDNSFFEFSESQKDGILVYGLANTAFLNIGPCGTISIVSENCTGGIEPLYMFSYKRLNRVDNKQYTFIHYLACKFMLKHFPKFEGLTLEEAKKKLNYVEANEIDYEKRIKNQSAFQHNADASISSTLNLPNDVDIETVEDVFMKGYDYDLKGVTIFRDGCKTGVLSSSEEKKEDVPNANPIELYEKELLDIESSERHRVIWKKNKLYMNVSLDEDDNPIEIFAKLPKEAGINGDGQFNPVIWQERTSHWDLTCRLISMCLRYGIDLNEILLQLEKSTYSMVDAAGILKRVLSRYLPNEFDLNGEIIGEECPKCGNHSYIKQGGCATCIDCGHSECG